MQSIRVERPLANTTLVLETGKLAKQAHGAVTVTLGETLVLAASVAGEPRGGGDFFPLTVDYREKTYAAGKFPGGFIKREGRPSSKEILTARLTDRPIRPLFPDDYFNEVQVQIIVLSADKDYDPDVLGMIGASASLHLAEVPFDPITGSVRVGRVNNELLVMPTYEQLDQSDLDLVVAGTRDAITMIEGFAREMPEDEMLQAIEFAHKHIVTIIEAIEELREKTGRGAKQKPEAQEANPLVAIFQERFAEEFKTRKLTEGKAERATAIAELKERVLAEFVPEEGESEYTAEQVGAAFYKLEAKVVRDMILEGKRMDGRAPGDLRDIACEVDVLPRTHGSAVFQRGETQALVVTTLGTTSDEQRIDGLSEEYSKKFMLDYNFPSFSVGECRPNRGPGRREIGHGALAERSLNAVMPSAEKFPYTVRLVSEILESNGSSSMASVCGGTLALMDAGVPITNPVAGISIGLVKEPDRFILLTDIMGDEDHFGDMDFKVAGTGRGITGIQLDLKIAGIDSEIIKGALQQAYEARRDILKTMLTDSGLRRPRGDTSKHAPRMLTIQINPDKIGLLIGPGGKTIKGIQEATGAKIDIDDDGKVYVSHSDAEGAQAAYKRVEAITEEVRVGKVYEGRVTSVKDFGAFVELLPGREGLCHISELDDKFIDNVGDVCKVGDTLQVKVLAIDEHDRVKLSRRVLLKEENAEPESGGPNPKGGGDSD